MSDSGNAEVKSADSLQTDGSDRRSGWVRVAVYSVVAPPVMFFATTVGLLLVTNSFDPAFELGISDTLLNGILIGLDGLLAGIVVALVARMRGAKLVLPPLVGLLVGVAIYLAFVAFEAGEYVELDLRRLVILWIGLSASLFLATRLTGYALVGAATTAVLVGIGVGAVLQATPEPTTEVVLILADYTVDETTGGCSGSGELSEVVEGSRILLIEFSNGKEVGSLVLPTGTEENTGCVFELGDPLGLSPTEYGEMIGLVPESGDPNVAISTNLEGHRVIITMGID